MSLKEISKCVSEGIKLLTKAAPNWYKLDVRSLDIGSCDDCVLGKLYGGYHNGLSALGIEQSMDADRVMDPTTAAGCGFASGLHLDSRDKYTTLRRQWTFEAYRARVLASSRANS